MKELRNLKKIIYKIIGLSSKLGNIYSLTLSLIEINMLLRMISYFSIFVLVIKYLLFVGNTVVQ